MADAPTPTRSLRASMHPQARMQQLLSEQTQADTKPQTHAEKNTEKNTPSHTDLSTENIAGVNTETDTEVEAEGNTAVRPPAQTHRRKGVKVEAKAAPGASARSRILEDLQKEPVVRKTIDIPASLNERLQEYCAANRIKTERRVFLVLLENFLDEEGF